MKIGYNLANFKQTIFRRVTMVKPKLRFLFIFAYLIIFASSIFAQPTITQQPTNQTVAVGQTAFFSLAASSANPISYQWYKNSVLITGATSNSYTTAAASLADNGAVFYCIVSDLDGSVQSNNATLLVGESPLITQDPANLSVTEGQPASFTVAATGTAPLQYQWRKNGVDITGATSTTFNIGATTLADNGSVYSCVVSNPFGIVLSNNATLTVNAGEVPAITQQPLNSSALSGQTATFTITASGTIPLQYQWYKNNVSIAGATSSSYTTPATVLADNNSTFYCSVTNSFGTVNSDTVSLFVTDASSRVTGGLQLLYEFEEGSGDVISDVSGVGTAEDIIVRTPDNVAWTAYGLETFKDAQSRRESKGSKIINAVNSTNEVTLEAWFKPEFSPQPNGRIFTFSVSGNYRNISLIQNGTKFDVRVRTTNTDVNGLPAFSSSSGVASDQLVHFVYTKDASGNASIYLNGVLDTTMTNAGDFNSEQWATDHWLAVGSEPLGGAYWRGVHYLTAVYNRALTAFEVNHNYNIATPFDEKPFFTIQPQDQYLLEGESLFLDSYAVSVLPTNYQWRKNGTDIPGATSNQLNLANLGFLDNGSTFECKAISSSGTTYSETATVFVTASDDRSNRGIQAFYTFREGSGNVINDVSEVGSPLNLNIYSTDAVAWETNGLRINSAPSVITTNSATKITTPLKSTNEMTIEAWVSAGNVSQSSPARIFTVSADGSNRNFSLGQNNDSYEVNLRTTSTDDNGTPVVNSSAGTVSASGFDHVVFTRASDGTAKFYINGTERVSTTVGGDFTNWNDIYLLSLGNEFGVDHHWKGLINLIAVFDRPLSNSEVLRNFNFGPYGVVEQPTNVTLAANEVGKITISWSDNSSNEDGFKIERGVGDPIVYTQIGDITKDSTLFTDENIVDNTVYAYRVKAYYSLGESDYSEPLFVKSLISPLNAPSGGEYTLDTDGYPILTWIDNSTNESNFIIERRLSISSEYGVIDTVNENTTSYKDLNVTANTTYVYRIMATNQDTFSVYSAEFFVVVLVGIEDLNEIPTEYSLSQNYPNPFNPTTSIKFGLPQNSNVSISLYNMLGQKVITLSEKSYNAGIHNLTVDASSLTSGIYIYSISAQGIDGNNFVQTRKMILLK